MYNIDVVPMVKSSLNVEPSSRHEVNNTGTDNDTEPVLKRFVYFKMRSIPRFMKLLFMTDAFDGFDFSLPLFFSPETWIRFAIGRVELGFRIYAFTGVICARRPVKRKFMFVWSIACEYLDAFAMKSLGRRGN